MNYAQLVAHFRGLSKAAQALDLERQNVNVWKKRRIPSRWQLMAAAISKGRLKADEKAKKDAAAIAPYFKANGNGSR